VKTTEWSVESYVLALSVRSAVDVVGGGADTVDDDCNDFKLHKPLFVFKLTLKGGKSMIKCLKLTDISLVTDRYHTSF